MNFKLTTALVACILLLSNTLVAQSYTYYEAPAKDGNLLEFADSVLIKYNKVAKELAVEIKYKKNIFNPDGFQIAMSPSAAPTNPGEIAIIYFDATFPAQMRLTAYGYNTYGDPSNCGNAPGSYELGKTTNQPADKILAHSSSWVKSTTYLDNASVKTLGFVIDTTAIETHITAYPSVNPWTGIGFGEKIGLWMWHTDLVGSPTYGVDGFLTKWQTTSPVNQACLFYDFGDRDTNTSPVCTIGTVPTTVKVGDKVNVSYTITDANADQVNITYAGLPTGAVASPNGLSATTVNGNIMWTPDTTFAGTSTTIAIKAVDAKQGQANCSFVVAVVNDQNPTPNCTDTDITTNIRSLDSLTVDLNKLIGSASNDLNRINGKPSTSVKALLQEAAKFQVEGWTIINQVPLLTSQCSVVTNACVKSDLTALKSNYTNAINGLYEILKKITRKTMHTLDEKGIADTNFNKRWRMLRQAGIKVLAQSTIDLASIPSSTTKCPK
jgi:hypothetical protein